MRKSYERIRQKYAARIEQNPKLSLFLQMFRFGVVGLLATLIHVGVFTLLIHYKGSWPSAANLAAFVVAFIVSFVGQNGWTFRDDKVTGSDKSRRLYRFIIVSLIGLLLNAVIVYLVTDFLSLPAYYAIPFMLVMVPAVLFLLNRQWAFASPALLVVEETSSVATNKLKSKLTAFVFFAVLSFVVMLPAFLRDDMQWGHDADVHRMWQLYFAPHMWDRIDYPRWIAEANDGFGSPVFFIYPPLSHLIAGLLYPVFPLEADVNTRIYASATLALFVGSVGIYLWLSSKTEHSWAALMAASVYLITPYHLFIDTYFRAAFGELWSFAPVPFILLGIDLSYRHPARGIVTIALATALLLLAHAPSILIVMPAAALYCMLTAASNRSVATIICAVVAVGLAVLLSAPYLFTALTQTNLINTSGLFGELQRSTNWLIGGKTWFKSSTQIAIYVVSFVQFILALLLLLIIFILRHSIGRRTEIFFATAIFALTVFVTSKFSYALWALETPLNKIQFPWRFLSLQAVALSVLVFVAAEACLKMKNTTAFKIWGGLTASVVLVLALTNAGLYGAWVLKRADNFHADSQFADSKGPPEYVLGDLAHLEKIFRAGEKLAVIEGSATSIVHQWEARRLVFDVQSSGHSIIAIRQFIYSGWLYQMDGGPASIARHSSVDSAVSEIDVPDGQHQFLVTLPPTSAERYGWYTAASGMVLLCAVFLGCYFQILPRKLHSDRRSTA